MHIRECGISRYRGSLFLWPYSTTVNKVNIGTAPLIVVAPDSTDSVIGEAVERTFAESKEGIPDLDDHSDLQEAVLKAAKVRSWGSFDNGAETVGGLKSADGYEFLPHKKEAHGRWFLPLTSKAVKLPSGTSVEAIGRAARQALDCCE